ncbi:MAG: DUF1648 domain-containing protein [Trueperaceae bacterium]
MTHKTPAPDKARRQAEERLRSRHLLVTVSVTALATLAYLLTLLLTAGRLPDTMATHFGVGGQPDEFMRTWVALLFQGAVVVFLPVALLVTFGFANWWKGEFARALSAMISGLCAVLATMFVVLTVAHVGVADPAEVRLTWQMGLIMLGVGVAVAMLVMFLLPRSLPRPEPSPVVPVEIAPNYRVSWFGKARMGQTFVITMAAATVLVVAATIASNIWWMWLIVLMMILLMAGLSSFDVVVDSRGVRWRSSVGFPRGAVRLRDITDISVIETSPGDFGGYGVRMMPGRIGIITRNGHALRVVHGDRELVITVDDAEVAAGVLEGWRLKGRGQGA